MKYLIVGAGNAGRPVARFLNYKNHEVVMTDPKEFNEFDNHFQVMLKILEDEGVILDLGNKNPGIEGFDAVFYAPSIPDNAPIMQKIKESSIKVLSYEEYSKMVDDEINIDIIGISGTMGKTTTTSLVSELFKEAGYKVWTCSSLKRNLVGETIVEGIVNGEHLNSNIAIFELPHGTMGLLCNLSIKIGLMTNLFEDHLSEFDNSLEKYYERKMLLPKMSKTFIANKSCKKFEIKDVLYYELDDDDSSDFVGKMEGETLFIRYGDVSFNFPCKMKSYFIENTVAASAIGLIYGIDQKYIISTFSKSQSVESRMDDYGVINGRKVIIDTSFLLEGMKTTLKYFKDENIVLFLDHFDTLTKRNKKAVGKLCGQYANVIIASAFDEYKQEIDYKGADEILQSIENSEVLKIMADDIDEAASLAFKYSKPGDLILHMGPSISFKQDFALDKIKKGIKEGASKYP